MKASKNLFATAAIGLLACGAGGLILLRAALIPMAPVDGTHPPRAGGLTNHSQWHGPLMLGENWLPPRRRSVWRPWLKDHPTANAPTLYFSGTGPGLVLELELDPAPQGALDGKAHPTLNGKALDSVALPAAGGQINIPLVSDLLLAGINRVALDSNGPDDHHSASWKGRAVKNITITESAGSSLGREPGTSELPVSSRVTNVFIYVIDTLRADAVHLEPHGATPAMASFAADAVVFTDAWSPSSWTNPSTVALLTGSLPSGLDAGAGQGPRWLARRLKKRNFDTLAISQSYVVSQKRFGRGFSNFHTADALSRGGNESHTVPWFLWQHLLARDLPEAPLFAYVHTVDPHGPYTPFRKDRDQLNWWSGWRPLRFSPMAVEERGQTDNVEVLSLMKSLYEGDVRHSDRGFGAFLDLLRFTGIYDSSLIVLTADHGEGFGEHGNVGHGRDLHEEVLRVPLMIKLPAQAQAGRRVAEPVSTTDVCPTILQALGIELPPFMVGRDLLAQNLLRRPLRAELVRRFEGPHPNVVFRSVRLGDQKCLWTSGQGRPDEIVAFDLSLDPGETNPSSSDAIRQQCLELLKTDIPVNEQDDPRTTMDQETARRLKALGYVATH